MAARGRPKHKPGESVAEQHAPEIFDRIARGESMRRICESLGIKHNTVVSGIMASDDLSDQYARAREQQADFYADQIIEIADEDEDYNRARVRIDARKWIACKLKPKRYGDKIAQEHSVDSNLAAVLQIVTKPKE